MKTITVTANLNFNDDAAADKFLAEMTGPDTDREALSTDIAQALTDNTVGFVLIAAKAG